MLRAISSAQILICMVILIQNSKQKGERRIYLIIIMLSDNMFHYIRYTLDELKKSLFLLKLLAL